MQEPSIVAFIANQCIVVTSFAVGVQAWGAGVARGDVTSSKLAILFAEFVWLQLVSRIALIAE
jgi:hypothetical protein